MKKIFLIVAVLMLATPALAVPPDVYVWAEAGDDANKVEIWYSVDPVPDCPNDGNRPRAFGLNIIVTDGNIIDINVPFEGECDDVNRGYGIFPGTISIVDGVVTNYGSSSYTPVAPGDAPGAEDTGLDTNTIVVEMGSLYTDNNCPDPCAMLFTFTVSLDCNVTIVGNAARTGTASPEGKGVVLENLAEVIVNFPEAPFKRRGVSRFVPDVVGDPYQPDACDAIEDVNLVVGDVTEECSLTIDAGKVISTDPVAGTELEQGSFVDVVVSLGECDFGDADDPTYPTLLASNGAVHIIVPGVYLGPGPQGTSIDAELDGQPDATATGDDIAGTSADDEDGVVFVPAGKVIKSGSVVQVTASVSGYLNAWLDKNADGDWDDASEQIFTDEPLNPPGPNNLPLVVGCSADSGTTVSRWRFTTYHTGGTLDYNGPAEDGEVEDHEVEIVCHVPDVCGLLLADACDAIVDACFNVGEITYECNDIIDACDAIRTEPAFCNYPECGTDVNIVVSTGPCEEECYAGQPDYDVWDAVGKPICWCYLRQCHADVDGKYEGGTMSGYYYVGYDDLNVLTTTWRVLEDCEAMWPGQPDKCEQWPGGLPTPSGPGIASVTGPKGEDGACADIKHAYEGGTMSGYYYVGYDDLNVLTTSWRVLEDCEAMWPGQPDKCEQWPGGLPTPSGSGIDPNCLPGNRTP